MSVLIRLILRLLLRHRWGMFILSALLVVVGLVVGVSSSQVSYIQSQVGTTYHLTTGQQSGNLYINASGSDDFYVAFSSDFTVPQSISNTSGISLHFIARSDTSSLDPAYDAPDGTTINDAHKIEKLTFMDSHGNVVGNYTTAEYTANPNGVYVNNWPLGLGIIGFGVLAAILSVWIYRRRQSREFARAQSGGFQQPAYAPPVANPYAQPYPGAGPVSQLVANSYPPYQQPYPGADPVANSYQQPYPGAAGQPVANPYQQPYPGAAGQPVANSYPPYQQPQQ